MTPRLHPLSQSKWHQLGYIRNVFQGRDEGRVLVGGGHTLLARSRITRVVQSPTGKRHDDYNLTTREKKKIHRASFVMIVLILVFPAVSGCAV